MCVLATAQGPKGIEDDDGNEDDGHPSELNSPGSARTLGTGSGQSWPVRGGRPGRGAELGRLLRRFLSDPRGTIPAAVGAGAGGAKRARRRAAPNGFLG